MEPEGIIYFILVFSPCVFGHQSFQSKIPNGWSVPDPCDLVTIWQGVGHERAGGSGTRNAFGVDFLKNGMIWNETLCQIDSDGDGISNGVELGDPDCIWEPGTMPAKNASGHPGICEPWSDTICLQQNPWYKCEKDLKCDAIKNPDVLNMTVTIPEMLVPPQETTYICMNFEFPNDTDYHIIADEGKIVNHNFIHHILVFACPSDVQGSDLQNSMNTPYTCEMLGEHQCGKIIAVWSVGSPGFCHNEMVGFKIGKTGYKFGTMQLHWNNPSMVPGQRDSSGLTLYYTPKLRPYNLGNLMLGESEFSILPGKDSYHVESVCSSFCTSNMMNQSIFAVAGVNHMHYLGKKMVTSLESEGRKLDLIHDSHYNYDNPVIHVFDTPVEVKPGDILKTKCTFQSTHKTVTTYSGDGTSDEMCVAFLLFYPDGALSTPRCTTYEGMEPCSLYSYTDYTDGCQLRSFIEDIPTITTTLLKIEELCGFTCRTECKEYIKEIRQNPCFQGRVGEYLIGTVRPYVDPKYILLYRSCDVEILLEKRSHSCQTDTPNSGMTVPNQMPLSLMLMLMVTSVMLTCF